MIIFLPFLLITVFLKAVLPGHIYTWDLELDYNNAGHAKTFKSSFSLETSLSKSDYIKLIFPFPLHFSSTNDVPDYVTASYSVTSLSHHCENPNENPATIILGPDDNSYLFQFLDSTGNPLALEKSKYYTTIIRIGGNNANIQSSGVKDPVQIFSVSSTGTYAIIYDSSSVGGVFALSDYPPKDIKVILINTHTLRYQPGATYTAILDISTRRKIVTAGRIELEFEKNEFKFSGYCLSVKKIANPIIPAIDPSLYTCTYNSITNKLTFFLNQTIEVNQQISIEFGIINPSFQIKNSSIYVRTLLSYSNTIIEIAQTERLLTVQPLKLLTKRVIIAWGMDTSLTSSYPFPLFLVRADSLSPKYNPYNSLKFSFSFVSTFPDLIMFEMEIMLPDASGSTVLPGSITHNLPGYSTLLPNCNVDNINDPPLRSIVCRQLGKLIIGINYFVAFKVTIPYDEWSTTIAGSFGKMAFYTTRNGVRDPLPLIEPVSMQSQFSTINNADWFITNPTGHGATIVNSQAATGSPNTPHTNDLGILPSDLDQRLIFTMNMPLTDVYNSVPVGDQALSDESGIVILMNPAITNSSTMNLEVKTTGTGSQNLAYQQVKITGDSSTSFTRLTLYGSKTSDLYGMFAYLPASGTALNWFAIKPIKINWYTSLYPNQDILDFYIASFEKINTASPAFRKLNLFNAYTLTMTTPSKLTVSVVNYYSGSTFCNSGDYFPSFLRVQGYLDAIEMGSISSVIMIFFDKLVPFFNSQNGNINPSVACSAGTKEVACNFYPSNELTKGQSYHNYGRVDVLFPVFPQGSVNEFHLLIPVSTVVNTASINIFLGVAGKDVRYTAKNTFYKLDNVFRISGGSNLASNQFSLPLVSSFTTSYSDGLSSMTYGLDATGLKVGDKGKDFLFNAGHSDLSSKVLPNDGIGSINNGAGFTVVSIWNFLSSDSLISWTLGTGSAGKCVNASYINSFTNGIPKTLYFIYCPYNTGSDSTGSRIDIIKGLIPYTNGNKLPSPTSFCWSDKSGILRGFNANPSSTIPNYGLISTTAATVITPKLGKNFKQAQLIWTFNTSNPISDGNVISIEFSASFQFSVMTQGTMCKLYYEASPNVYQTLAHLCTVSVATNKIVFTISQCITCPFPAGKFQLRQWGVDNPNLNGVAIAFNIVLYVGSNKIDQTIITGSFEYDNTATEPLIALSNFLLDNYNRRSKTSLRFSFKMTSRAIWFKEKIIINLGGVANDNIVNTQNMRCQIYDGTQISTSWLSMKISDLSAIELLPKDHIDIIDKTFDFYCDGVITPYSYNPSYISLYLGLQNSNTIIKSSDVIIIDGKFMDENLFPLDMARMISKLHNTPGSSLDIFYNITASKTDINNDLNSFLVDFPIEYSPRLGNLLYCEINGIPATCSVTKARRLTLPYLPVSISVGKSFSLRIFGVVCPSATLEGRYFIFSIVNKTNVSNLIEYGEISDINPSANPETILVQQFTMTNNYIRTNSKYNFLVNLPAGSISTAKVITVDFPIEWDLIINYKTPICRITDQSRVNNFAGSCTSYGNRVKITIDTTDISGDNTYYIILDSVRNPDNTFCDPNKWIISVLNVDELTVIARTEANQMNLPILPFIRNPSEINLRWTYPSDTGVGADINILDLSLGVHAQALTLVPDFGIFMRSFTISSKNSDFSFKPSSPKASFGYPNLQVTFSANKDTTPGLYLIEVIKSDDFGVHTQIPFLKVNVQNNKYLFPLELSEYVIALAGSSLPIIFNITNISPESDLKVDASFLEDSPGVSFINTSTILLTTTNTIGAFYLTSDGIKSKAGQSGRIVFRYYGSNKDNYYLTPPVNMIVVPTHMEKPILTDNSDASPPGGATYVQLKFSCDTISTIYYYIGLYSSKPRSNYYMKYEARKFLTYDDTNPYQEQIGMLLESTSGNILPITIYNLLPSQSYNVTAVCEDLNGNFSDSISRNVTTGANLGLVYKIKVNISISISSDLYTRLTCYFASYYKIPPEYVQTVNSLYCSNQRRMLQTTTNSNNSTSANSTTNINGTNSTNSTCLNQTTGLLIENCTNTSNSSNTTEPTEPVFHQRIFYILPSMDKEKDVIGDIVKKNSYTEADMINWLEGNITGMPAVVNLTQPVEIDSQFYNEIKEPTYINLTSGLSWICISNLTLLNEGFIYIGISPVTDVNLTKELVALKGKNTTNQTDLDQVLIKNTTNLTYYQVRKGLDENDKTIANVSQWQLFNKTGPLVFNFTYLKNNTFYKIYIYATIDNPSIYAWKTPFQIRAFNTRLNDILNINWSMRIGLSLSFCVIGILLQLLILY